jgi:hypothetical protein
VVHRQSPAEGSQVCARGSRPDRLAEKTCGRALDVSAMPEARHSTLLCDVRQTSPWAATVSVPHQSVAPSDLDLRQMARASERRGHEVESRSNLGPGRRPWRRTDALRWVPGPRLEAPAAVDRSSSMEDLIRCRAAQRRVRPDLVVPVLEPRQGGAEGAVVERDELVRKSLFLEGTDEPLMRSSA